MTFHEITIVFLAFAGWILGLYLLERRGLLSRVGLTMMGPFLMAKTLRGRALIERIAQWRGWGTMGRVFVVLVAVTMVGMTALLVWTATLVSRIPPEAAPSPQVLLGLPGINPFIPLTYGIFALAVAIIVHEFSHGILARKWKVKIKSLGILLFIVPIGAFVEPDEEDMQALDRPKRGAIFAAGPGSNVVLAALLAVIFSIGMMSAVQAKAPGMGITSIVPESPAEGVLAMGMIITHIDGDAVETAARFTEVLGQKTAGQVLFVDIFQNEGSFTRQITLADRFDFTDQEADRGKGFIGVGTVSTNPDIFNPIVSSQRLGIGAASLLFILFPFSGMMPMQPPLTDFYTLTGAWAIFPTTAFFVLANTIYWLFWINLMLGMTNALPAVPLDGGYLFRDWVEAGLKRIRRGMKAEAAARIARNLSYVVALFILALILWQLIGPRI
ncbi:MAG: site-2 protease family protein [Candidatus Thermoplasmatota archaeon]|nr:site-2 protease family protein [Candidatus Thermoplasmatota archaeon]